MAGVNTTVFFGDNLVPGPLPYRVYDNHAPGTPAESTSYVTCTLPLNEQLAASSSYVAANLISRTLNAAEADFVSTTYFVNLDGVRVPHYVTSGAAPDISARIVQTVAIDSEVATSYTVARTT